jgi:glycosyltransferase involved in cell wall biosynthesis
MIPRFALVSSGLGVVRRGFEVSTLAWARALRADGRLQVEVYSGGRTPESRRLPCLTQTSPPIRLARWLHLMRDGARTQQRTIIPALRWRLQRDRPDFVWLQEWTLARSIQPWLRQKGLPSRLIFCNGAPVSADDCTGFDFVMDLHFGAHEASLRAGIPPERLLLLPHPCVTRLWESGKQEARARLGLPVDRPVVACMAAWNRHHKRIHILLEAAAQSGIGEMHLLLCGQAEREAGGLRELADRILPRRTTWMTLPPDDLPAAYAAADLFVLPSLTEGLGAVLIEAASAGLPVLAHRMPATEFIFGTKYPGLMDMTHPEQLARRLGREIRDPSALRAALPQAEINARFSPATLAGQMQAFVARHLPDSR